MSETECKDGRQGDRSTAARIATASARALLPMAAMYTGRDLNQVDRGEPGDELTRTEAETLHAGLKRLLFEVGELAAYRAPPPGATAYREWQPRARSDVANDVPAPSVAYLVSAFNAVSRMASGDSAGAAQPAMRAGFTPGMSRAAIEFSNRWSGPAAATRTGLGTASSTSTAMIAQQPQSGALGQRLLACLVEVLCEFLRCLESHLCKGGRLGDNIEWGAVVNECARAAICSLLRCLPDALCPPERDEPSSCAPDPLACDFAVESERYGK